VETGCPHLRHLVSIILEFRGDVGGSGLLSPEIDHGVARANVGILDHVRDWMNRKHLAVELSDLKGSGVERHVVDVVGSLDAIPSAPNKHFNFSCYIVSVYNIK